jgi:hypothetical protein
MHLGMPPPLLGVSAHEDLSPPDVVLGPCHVGDLGVLGDWGVVIIKQCT